MAVRTTGVTGMLVQDTGIAHNVTVVVDVTGFYVRDNEDGSVIADYEPAFARWITQRQFVRVLKRRTGKDLFDIKRVQLDALMMADLKAVGFTVYDHEAFITKMDAPRSKAILAGIETMVAKRSAAAA